MSYISISIMTWGTRVTWYTILHRGQDADRESVFRTVFYMDLDLHRGQGQIVVE